MGTDSLITRRKLIGVTAAAVGAALLTSCSKPQAGPEKATAVVFYSQTGNTAGIAAPTATWLPGMRFAPGTDSKTVAEWIDSLSLE